MAIDSSNPNGKNCEPLAFILIWFSATLMVIPIYVVIEASGSELRQSPVSPSILVGLPVLGALVGAFLRFQGKGGGFFGITLGVFVAGLISMALLACWIHRSAD
ncbi:hypothetical protein [Streptosporangium sp. NPDC051022]|uniref:hypothetical protein n=1 Tax=Streptosporangium sp. NPDC051022 TaxID=3155752 RepID=UPI003424C481